MMTPEKLLERVRRTHGNVLNLARMTHWFEKYGADRLEEVVRYLPPPGRCRNTEAWMRHALEEGWTFRKPRRRQVQVQATESSDSYKAQIARLVLGPSATATDYDNLALRFKRSRETA